MLNVTHLKTYERFVFLFIHPLSKRPPLTYPHQNLGLTRVMPLPTQSCMKGLGVHPHTDPWGRCFSMDFHPDRWKLAGTPLSGNYVYCLDGVQGDADFVAAMFGLKRLMPSNTKYVFFYTPPLKNKHFIKWGEKL